MLRATWRTLDSGRILGDDMHTGVLEPRRLPFAFSSVCLVLVAPSTTSQDRKS